MNDYERAICARVKLLREQLGWTQANFADSLGVSKERLASIEYGRTPLRYDLAWSMAKTFGVSLAWMEEGFGPPNGMDVYQFDPPANDRKLLSQVMREMHESHLKCFKSMVNAPEWSKLDPKAAPLNASVRNDRHVNQLFLEMWAGEWIAGVPDEKVGALADHITRAANEFIASLPRQSAQTRDARADQLAWERLRIINAKRFLRAGESDKKKFLTQVDALVRLPNVKAPLKNLLHRANHLTKETGKKSELARFLHVPLASLSRWLSGKREPGGEATLQLLRWVEQQERK